MKFTISGPLINATQCLFTLQFLQLHNHAVGLGHTNELIFVLDICIKSGLVGSVITAGLPNDENNFTDNARKQ